MLLPQIETKCLTVVAATVEEEDTVDSAPSCVRASDLAVARRLVVVVIIIGRIVVELMARRRLRVCAFFGSLSTILVHAGFAAWANTEFCPESKSADLGRGEMLSLRVIDGLGFWSDTFARSNSISRDKCTGLKPAMIHRGVALRRSWKIFSLHPKSKLMYLMNLGNQFYGKKVNKNAPYGWCHDSHESRQNRTNWVRALSTDRSIRSCREMPASPSISDTRRSLF